MTKVFLLSEETIKSNSVVNNNVDSMYLLPAIDDAQTIGLQPIIGTQLFNKLRDLVADNEISLPENKDYKDLLDEYITPYLINKVTADIQLPLAYKLRNQGVIQNVNENTTISYLKDTQYLIEHYENKAKFYANRLSDFLMANSSKYPEYNSVESCSDMPSDNHAYKTNIYLG